MQQTGGQTGWAKKTAPGVHGPGVGDERGAAAEKVNHVAVREVVYGVRLDHLVGA